MHARPRAPPPNNICLRAEIELSGAKSHKEREVDIFEILPLKLRPRRPPQNSRKLYSLTRCVTQIGFLFFFSLLILQVIKQVSAAAGLDWNTPLGGLGVSDCGCLLGKV